MSSILFEMINILYFLKEVNLINSAEFEYKTIEMVTECLHLHFLRSAGCKDERMINKMMRGINKHHNELRKLTLKKSTSFSILNKIIAEMPTMVYFSILIYITKDSKSFNNRKLLNCHGLVPNDFVDRHILRKQQICLFVRNTITTMNLYENLEVLL